MKQLLFLFLFISFSAPVLAQKNADGKLVWYTDVLEAQKQSEATHKPIFGFFTGSDWCGWCHKLQNEVFEKAAFIKWAKANVILLELDFPRSKQLPPQIVKQNNELQQVFKVSGYPTVWVFFLAKDAATNKMNITALGSLGYPSGAERGREEVKFLENANNVLTSKKEG